MVAAPWYLLAGGIFVIIIGYFVAATGRGSGQAYISPKMSDEEIERAMNEAQGSPVGNLIMLAGFVLVFISICWRLVRFFV
jgi:hypothetical protein